MAPLLTAVIRVSSHKDFFFKKNIFLLKFFLNNFSFLFTNSVKEKESIYADVPNDMFYCHLCKKHMWDSNSFENHIKGRTHLMMREGIEESYRLKANMIRQEAKIAEQLKLIELDRLKRMGKSGKAQRTEYCTMCDLNFHGHISAHRKSDGHLTLKKFLHPKCVECNREFPTRIEYDTHLLTPEHLKKAAERNTKVGERKKNTLTILTEEDELKDVKQPTKRKKKVEPKKEGEETDEKKENGEAAAEGEEEKKEGEEAGEEEAKDDDEANQTVVEDPEDVIIDYHDGEEVPAEVDSRIPKYNWLRPVGTSLICKLECFECSICAKFFDTDKTAEVHSRTMSHHRQFVKFINEKSSDTKIAQKRAAAALEENERKKRKLEEAATEEEGAVKTENGEEGEKPSDELYDPSEATGEGEDEDVEMLNENEDQGDEAEESIKESIKEEEVNGKVEDTSMKEDEKKDEPQDAEMAEPEPEPEPEPEKPVETKKEEKPTPAKPTTPQKAAATPQKATPAARGGAQAKGTPRGRGRGRYNRF